MQKPSSSRRAPVVQFYWRWFRTAFASAWGLAAGASLLAWIIVPIVAHYSTTVGERVNRLTWELGIGAAGIWALIRLGLAPYWIWRDDTIVPTNKTYLALTDVVHQSQMLLVAPQVSATDREAFDKVHAMYLADCRSLQALLKPHEWQSIIHVKYAPNEVFLGAHDPRYTKACLGDPGDAAAPPSASADLCGTPAVTRGGFKGNPHTASASHQSDGKSTAERD